MANGAQAVCVFVNDQVDRACLEALAAQGVKLVALRCTGFNNVDIAAAKALNLTVTRVPVYSPYAVAEHAVALLLTLNRKIHRSFNRVRELNFSLNGLVGFDLHGKTAGIVGTGKIGRIIAQILRGFGMKVLAYDPFPNRDWAAQEGVEYVDASELAGRSDVISLHVPLTPETKYLIRRETLSRMKPGAILINVSRGALIDTTALIEALKSGRSWRGGAGRVRGGGRHLLRGPFRPGATRRRTGAAAHVPQRAHHLAPGVSHVRGPVGHRAHHRRQPRSAGHRRLFR